MLLYNYNKGGKGCKIAKETYRADGSQQKMATIGKLRNGNVIILFKKNEMAKIEIEKIVKIENKKKQK